MPAPASYAPLMSVQEVTGTGSLSSGVDLLPVRSDDGLDETDESVGSNLRRARWAAIGFVAGSVLLGPFAPLVWAVVIVDFFRRYTDWGARVLLLKQMGATLVAVPTGVVSFFVVGETMTDPGGLRGAVAVTVGTACVAAVATLCWVWPKQSLHVLSAGAFCVVTADIWYALDAARWRSFEDDHGPVFAVVNFLIVVVTAIVAWKRPGVGGAVMASVSATALFLAVFVDELVPAALSAAFVGLLPGALMIVADALDRRGRFMIPVAIDGRTAGQAG